MILYTFNIPCKENQQNISMMIVKEDKPKQLTLSCAMWYTAVSYDYLLLVGSNEYVLLYKIVIDIMSFNEDV